MTPNGSKWNFMLLLDGVKLLFPTAIPWIGRHLEWKVTVGEGGIHYRNHLYMMVASTSALEWREMCKDPAFLKRSTHQCNLAVHPTSTFCLPPPMRGVLSSVKCQTKTSLCNTVPSTIGTVSRAIHSTPVGWPSFETSQVMSQMIPTVILLSMMMDMFNYLSTSSSM